MTDEPPTPAPDLSAELQRLSAARIARLRQKKQGRTELAAARIAGLRRRHAEKLERIRRDRDGDR